MAGVRIIDDQGVTGKALGSVGVAPIHRQPTFLRLNLEQKH
jgi:hypothetical protein